MSEYRLSEQADADILAIAEYAIGRFGVHQSRHYRDELINCFRMLAELPGMGRPARLRQKTLMRFEHHSHVVIYEPSEIGVLIVRVLHDRMDPKRHVK